MFKFRIYYGDGSTYSEDPFFAPPAGVQAVVQACSTKALGYEIMIKRHAFYWKDDCGWRTCDTAGLWDYLMMYHGPKAVLFGRSIRDEAFWDIAKKATLEGLG